MDKVSKQVVEMFKVADKGIAFHTKAIVWFNEASKQYGRAVGAIYAGRLIKKISCKWRGWFCHKIARIYSRLGEKYHKRYLEKRAKLDFGDSPIKVIEKQE